ncbi:MAG TPA: TIGR03619 family F420-dependent LLM class oxidoreductase [Acidimicrobiales bacterium]|nr:TIGR03619 family F420-dependent LLM class oxidoreductase [Acidimicrobiales bacterium]
MTLPLPVPAGSLAWGMQLPVQALSRTFREPWEEEATVADLVRVAQAVEAAGGTFVGVCDHVALPPVDYTKHMSTTWYDTVATLGYLAAATSSVRLLSVVYIAPYRHPLVGAKSFMTLDRLSGGRVVMGVGAGHVESEFESLGVDFRTRGARLNESIDAMRAAFRDEYSEFHGEFYDYGPVGMGPRPVQANLPIWIGGSTGAALRRVAERGDGWIPQGTPRDQMQQSVDAIRAHRDKVRPGAHIDLGFMPGMLYVGAPGWDVGEWTLSGEPEKLAGSLRQAHDFGCTVLHVRFRSRSCDELCDQVAAFGSEVAPHLGA